MYFCFNWFEEMKVEATYFVPVIGSHNHFLVSQSVYVLQYLCCWVSTESVFPNRLTQLYTVKIDICSWIMYYVYRFYWKLQLVFDGMDIYCLMLIFREQIIAIVVVLAQSDQFTEINVKLTMYEHCYSTFLSNYSKEIEHLKRHPVSL